MKKYFKDYLILTLIAGSVIVLDQWTKTLVRSKLPIGDIWVPWPWLAPIARIVHWKNTGAAFGMFQNFGGVFAFLAVIVALVIIYYFPRIPAQEWPLRIALGLQLGGAVGNLIDRVTQGGRVTDFISVGRFAVFNVADASISMGVAVLIIGLWINEHQQGSHEDSPEDSQTDPPFPPSLPEEFRGE